MLTDNRNNSVHDLEVNSLASIQSTSSVKPSTNSNLWPIKKVEKIFNHHSYYANSTFKDVIMLPLKSYQQTTEYTCGPAAVVTLLNYYGLEGDEIKIAKEMGTRNKEHLFPGTSPDEINKWLNQNGFYAEISEENKDGKRALKRIKENLRQGVPILVEWIDWSGHWAVVAGYLSGHSEDGSEDVLILADPAACFDRNKTGFTYVNAEKFDSMWFDAFYFGKIMRRIHIIAYPKW